MGQVYFNMPQGIGIGVLAKNFIPIISPSTCTMGNNGAFTLMTAHPTTYTGGAWVLWPAGGIAAGVPAAATYYWTVFSSATAGTVFNNIMPANYPFTPPASTTAFVTTGPGSVPGNTAATVLATVQIPAMSANAVLRISYSCNYTNSAGTKTHTVKLGAGTIFALTPTTTTNISPVLWCGNEGTQANQLTDNVQNGANTTPSLYTTVSTTGTVNLTFNNTNNTATDNFVLDYFVVELISDGT